MTNEGNITIFALPKAFKGRNGIIQRNSIKSWTLLNPRPEIILLGDDEGVAEFAAEIGVKYEPNVKRNEFGTPIVSDIFARAATLSTKQILAYVNADIILFDSFLKAANICAEAHKDFLMVGRRWNLDLEQEIDFSKGSWREDLRAKLIKTGFIYPTGGMDYFCYTRSTYEKIPDFAIGRTVWDNWLVWDPLSRGKAVIDATPQVLSVHHNHDYAHVPGDKTKAFRAWTGDEGKRNQELGGKDYPKGDLGNVTLEIRDDKIVSRASIGHYMSDFEARRLSVAEKVQNISSQLASGDYATSLRMIDEVLGAGISYRGLHHLKGLILITLKKDMDGARELSLELADYPGQEETRTIAAQLLPADLSSEIMRERFPDMHESETRAVISAVSLLANPVRVLDLSEGDVKNFYRKYVKNCAAWDFVPSDSGTLYDLIILPCVGSAQCVTSAYSRISETGLIIVPAAKEEVSDFNLPESCLLIHFRNANVVPIQGTTGGVFFVMKSEPLCESLCLALEDKFPSDVIQRRISTLSSIRWSMKELMSERAGLMRYQV